MLKFITTALKSILKLVELPNWTKTEQFGNFLYFYHTQGNYLPCILEKNVSILYV